ncbi:hypothetical protein ACFLXK_05315 [Chloroflexota bacterium]
MDKIDYNYISNAIDELVSLLGIKEDVPIDTILEPFSAGDIKGCIENIAHYLGLPVVVNISYVPAKYQRDSRDRFETSALVKTDRAGQGVEGITAQVSIPSYLPSYGSSGLQNFPISVKISNNCQRHPAAFMAVMAHELSHILLHSLRHKEKDNEFYTDLTAMVLGFSYVVLSGRKVVETRENYASIETTTITYGYLSDEQFNFAFNKIDKILEKYKDLKEKLIKKLATYKNLLSLYKKEVLKFNNFVEELDKNPTKKIGSQDGAKIVEFHQSDYADRFTAIMRSNEARLTEINDFCVGLVHYSQPRLNSLQKHHKEIDTLISDIKREFDLLHGNVNTLRKYVGFFYKRKINRQSSLI